jgi:hypothetical protein
MAILTWRHGMTKAQVRDAIRAELRELGHEARVTWEDFKASASVGWGAVLNVAGEVTDHTIVLERCGGAAGATVLRECRRILERLFPGGEEP